MSLRTRLALTLVLAALPVMTALLYGQQQLMILNTTHSVGEVLQRIAGDSESCSEFMMQHYRPRGMRPITIYSSDYRRVSLRGPQLSEEMKRDLAAVGDVASGRVDGPRRHFRERMTGGEDLLIARRVAATGNCAVIAMVRPASAPRLIFTLIPAVVATGLALILSLLVAWPLVIRIRRLTGAVERGQREAVPVEGSDELSDLARAISRYQMKIEAQIQELAERDAALARYVAHTSHDVMIPLTVVQNCLWQLDQAEVSDRSQVLRQAVDETHYLGSILQNLSSVLTLDSTTRLEETHVFDLGALVERVVFRHAYLAKSKDIECNTALPSAPVLVEGDETLLERSISNLLQNAIRYGHPSGHVAVVLDRHRGGFVLRVEDDGPGVREDELARLKEPRFRSAEARTRAPGGTGLGLAIVAEVAERHNFQLTFANGEERGFVATLSGQCRSKA